MVERRTVRRILGGLAVAAGLGPAAAVGAIGPGNLARCVRSAWRLERGTSPDAAWDLRTLGRSARGLGFAQRILEANLAHPDGARRLAAMKGLAAGFPESDVARAVRELEDVTGHDYFGDGYVKYRRGFGGRGARPGLALDEAIRRLRALAAIDFPGRDDVGLRLARCQEEAGDPVSAYRTLVAALGWGDGDAHDLCRDRIANVLDAQASVADVEALLAEESEPGRRRALLYTLGVKLGQTRRFEAAVATLDALLSDPLSGKVAWLELSPRYFVWRGEDGACVRREDQFLDDVKAQRERFTRLAALEQVVAASPDPDARARASAEQGTIALEDRHAFTNLFLHDLVASDRFGRGLWELGDRGPPGPDARFLAYLDARHHLEQAVFFFERAARTTRDADARTLALVEAARARLRAARNDGELRGHELAGSREAREARAIQAALAAVRSGADRPRRIAASALIEAAARDLGDDLDLALRRGAASADLEGGAACVARLEEGFRGR